MVPTDNDPPRLGQAPVEHTYVLPPSSLPGFPEAQRVRPKGGRNRWKDRRGWVYEWDYRHGAVELYDTLGRHLGEFDYKTGRRLKPGDPRRSIDP